MGARAHHFILKYFDQLEGAIVEIGTTRFEGSTDFYAGLAVGCKQFQHHAIDFDPDSYNDCKVYAERISNFTAYCMTGEHFLKEVFPGLNQKICYAYLDNFDYNYTPDDTPWWVDVQQKRYKELGVEMTNENSEKAHLEQAQLIQPFVADNCVIQLDDTWNQNNAWRGKGARAVPYLIDQGWQLVYTNDRSVALINF